MGGESWAAPCPLPKATGGVLAPGTSGEGLVGKSGLQRGESGNTRFLEWALIRRRLTSKGDGDRDTRRGTSEGGHRDGRRLRAEARGPGRSPDVPRASALCSPAAPANSPRRPPPEPRFQVKPPELEGPRVRAPLHSPGEAVRAEPHACGERASVVPNPNPSAGRSCSASPGSPPPRQSVPPKSAFITNGNFSP